MKVKDIIQEARSPEEFMSQLRGTAPDIKQVYQKYLKSPHYRPFRTGDDDTGEYHDWTDNFAQFLRKEFGHMPQDLAFEIGNHLYDYIKMRNREDPEGVAEARSPEEFVRQMDKIAATPQTFEVGDWVTIDPNETSGYASSGMIGRIIELYDDEGESMAKIAVGGGSGVQTKMKTRGGVFAPSGTTIGLGKGVRSSGTHTAVPTSVLQKYDPQGVAEGFPHDVDHMPGPRIKNPQTGCERCHGKGYVYKTADGKVLPSNEQGAKRYKCGACGGIGFVKKGVAESTTSKKAKDFISGSGSYGANYDTVNDYDVRGVRSLSTVLSGKVDPRWMMYAKEGLWTIEHDSDYPRGEWYTVTVTDPKHLRDFLWLANETNPNQVVIINSVKGVAEGKRPDRYHIVGKDGKPANLASYADRASAIKDRDEKYPGAVVQQVGPRGKVKDVAEAGPFSYGKAPRKGSVADLAAKKRKEQEKGKQPIEPKDQMIGTAKVTKGAAEGSETAADIDRQIEFHKQGQAAAQYRGAMNKMHAKKIKDLEAKKQALKQGVAEGSEDSQDRIQELKNYIDTKERVLAGGNALSTGEQKALAQARKELKQLKSKQGVAEGKVSGYKKYRNPDGTWYVQDENENVVLRNASEGEAEQAVSSGNQKLKQGVAEGLRDPEDNPCWKGYHPVGTKKKNGRTVPNCVPNPKKKKS